MTKKILIYSVSSTDKYAYCTCNFHYGCDNTCEYCCLNHIFYGRISPIPKIKNGFRNEKQMLEYFEKEVTHDLSNLQKYGIFFSLTTDPLGPNTKEIVYKALDYCLENNIPSKVLTKCTEWYNDPWIRNIPMDKKDLINFGFSLSGVDSVERNMPSNDDRVELMKKLYDTGFKTYISAEPIINVKDTIKILKKALPYSYFLRIDLLSKSKYNNPILDYNFNYNDINYLYKWLEKNTLDSLVYLGPRFIKKLNIKRNKLDLTKFAKTGDIITEVK